MRRVDCSYCGLPFKVRRVEPGEKLYCCAGCALADRVKTGDGHFPITPELVMALIAGFAAFNQVLGILLSWLMAGEGRAVLAERFWWGSLAAGTMAWGLVAIAQYRSGARRVVDGAIVLAGLVLLVLGSSLASRACALAGTALAIGWSARGWGRSRARRQVASGLHERPPDSV